ncbi:MAG TPA: ferric reductase-like transmembrane domain-containing protein [Longimicrobiaceae bacterium]|jgi:DMSO/TMAO reductase YedYZ heme-binding membrane subunit|nr:ferric reductase-like transmembrane domain-containing protein [Longimicrobiaceae bacterium]
MDLDPIDLSGVVGLTALGLLTLNILLGLLMSVKYNPVRQWPHRKINTFKIHNWTGYTALAVAVAHPLLILLSSTAKFRFVDIVYPVNSPTQPWVNTLGALALYCLIVVAVTSYFRLRLGRKTWKRLHYTAYAAAALFFVHGLFTDPLLKDRPVDWIDAEKVFVELCILIVIGAVTWRVVHSRRHPKGRALARLRSARTALPD